MEATVEIVETIDGSTVSDEVYAMGECPSCSRRVAEGWANCPSCGAELGELQPIGECRDVGDGLRFGCSRCGRSYLPIQVGGDGGILARAEWGWCPGCGAPLAKQN